MKISVKKLRDAAVLPVYQTEHSAGMDAVACLDEPLVLAPHARVVVPTGIAVSLPPGYEIQVRARSGLAAKHGITTANGVGTIDADYRGELGVILLNTTAEEFTITPGMRVAQLVVSRYEHAEWQPVADLDETPRGVGGFGSTGGISSETLSEDGGENNKFEDRSVV